MKAPIIKGTIKNTDLLKLLKKKLKTLFHTPVIYLVDRKYQLTTKKELERFLKQDKTDLAKYVPEFHDCDNFAFRLLGQITIPGWSGLTFGTAFSKIHAYNLFIDNNKDIYIIEPQNDLLFKIDEVPKKYKKLFLPVMFVVIP